MSDNDSISSTNAQETSLIGQSILAKQTAKIATLQAKKALNSFDLNSLSNLNKSLNFITAINADFLAAIPKMTDIINPFIQAQIQFRTDYLKLISQSINSYSVLEQISKQWTQTLVSFKADILGLKFDFQYARKDYNEHRQLVVELDEGVTENGLEVYQTFEKEGKKYKLVAVPEQDYQRLTNTYAGVILDKNDIKLSISTQMTTTLQTDQTAYFSYDSKIATLFVGNYQRTLARGFVHRSLGIITKNKSNMKKVWHYSELLEMDDPEELNKKDAIKKCKDSFYYLRRNLPPEIKDFLTVKSDHVYINEKYIK